MSHIGTGLRAAALIAGLAATAGCQGFPGFGEPSRVASAPADPPAAVRTTKAARDDRPLDRAGVRRLQAGLARLGFRPGPIDGLPGPRTAGAVKRYRAAHHLPTRRPLTRDLLRHVEKRLAAARAAKPAAKHAAKPAAPPPPNLSPADLPAYRPGTTLVYSDGHTEHVAAATGAVVQWVRGDGTRYTANRNFLLPRTAWSSDGERGTARISAAEDELLPRHKGAEVAFAATLMVQRNALPDVAERRVESWRCRNEGKQDITVKLGTFDTLVLVCERGAPDETPKLVRTWYYAKSIRHYVRYVEHRPESGTTRSADLVAVRPGAVGWPPIVRAALTRAVVHALDSGGERIRMPWTSSGVNTSVIIEATARFAVADGRVCRRFVQVWSTEGRSRSYPAVACKGAAGRWTLPGLEGSAPALLATSGEFS